MPKEAIPIFITPNERGSIGSILNPMMLPGPIPTEWPGWADDEKYIYVVPHGGTMTKWYRSYADYCD